MEFIPIIVVIIFFIRFINRILKQFKKVNPTAFDNVVEELKRRAVTTTSIEEFEDSYKEVDVIIPETTATEIDIPNNHVNDHAEIFPAQSAEITQAPYSNLEEGILDETHLSKFPHHKEKKIEIITKDKDAAELFDKVSLQQAFKYSIIFNRKYF